MNVKLPCTGSSSFATNWHPFGTRKNHGLIDNTGVLLYRNRYKAKSMIIFLPDKKRQGLRELIQEVQRKKSSTKEELQSLAGKLQHASKVIKPGRCFIQSAYELASLRQNPHDRVRLTRDFKGDLSWLVRFLGSMEWNVIVMGPFTSIPGGVRTE